jgi:hypothetical protein
MKSPHVLVLAALALFGMFLSASVLVPLSKDAAASSSSNRVAVAGTDWYLHGANMPWYNWRLDFGGGSSGVAALGDTVIAPRLAEASDSGVKVVRWWVFEGDAWQISRDASGPTGLNSNIWKDFDKAVELAERYDLYYQFVLFSDPRHLPLDWQTDAAKRQKLADVLAPLFARYAGNPRVMAWEVYNEPDWAIWNAGFPLAAAQETTRAIAASVKTHAPGTHVTVGAAMMDGLKHWTGLGLTFYQAHWYDYMSSGYWCALCHDYEFQKARYNLDKPLIIGEYFGGPTVDALGRMQAWYDKGYAGAYAWSLFWERTNDKMQVDLEASKAFAARHDDLGPAAGSPSSGPTVELTASATATPTVEPATEPPASATATPTVEPTATATATPTAEPTATPTADPTATSTPKPKPERQSGVCTGGKPAGCR